MFKTVNVEELKSQGYERSTLGSVSRNRHLPVGLYVWVQRGNNNATWEKASTLVSVDSKQQIRVTVHPGEHVDQAKTFDQNTVCLVLWSENVR